MASNGLQTLTAWQRHLLGDLTAQLMPLLDKAVDSLMALAEHATSNQLQGSFFHAQQEIRREREAILADYLDSLDEQIHHKSPWQRPVDADSGELDLINIERFERDVAIQRITDRSIQDHHAVLHQLKHRLSALHQGRRFDDGDLPAGPVQLLRALDDALRPLGLDRVAQAHVFEIFHKVLLHEFAARHYNDLNDQLRDAGVLPNLRLQVSPAPNRGKAAASTSDTPAPSQQPVAQPQQAPAANNSIDSELVEQIRTLMPGSQGTGGQAPAGPGGAGPGAQTVHDAVSVAQLIDAQREQLGSLLPEHQVFSADGGHVQVSQEQLAESLKALIAQRHAIKRMVGPDKLSVFDESTLDIVGALFEMMLNDANLTAPVKALLSHLHTPYLKLALRENDLLTKADHPARKLLDELVSAGESWAQVEHIGNGVFPTLQDIVEVLRSAETPTRSLIEEQREYLGQRVETLYKRQQQRLSRTTDTEIGRARLDQAKHLAEGAIVKLIGETQICQAAADFLMAPWHDYLTLLLLKHNCETESSEWQAAHTLGERIVKAASKLARTEQPSTADLWEIQQGLEDQVGQFIPHYMADVEKLLAVLHQLADKEIVADTPALRPAALPKAAPAKHPGEDLKLTEAEQKTAEHLRKLTGNNHFRIPLADGTGSRLVTLTWFNPHTDRMLFVDQEGAKAALLPVTQLARCLHNGTAKLIRQNKQPFFTRALKALKSYLEKHTPARQGVANG